MVFIHKALKPLRTVFCLVLFITLPFISLAQASDFKIEGVEVDVTAENAVQAREKAFEEAQLKAFKQLAERVLSPEDFEHFAMPDLTVISGYVQDFEVTNEQLSTVRYKGTYTFRFRPDAITGHMHQADTSFSIPLAQSGLLPVLILPYTQDLGGTNIWDEQNPFMKAWQRAITTNRDPSVRNQLGTIVPIGDLLDIQQVYDDPALSYIHHQIQRITARYEARESIIAIAERTPNGGLDVSLYKTERAAPEFLTTARIPANPGYPEMQLYDAAVRESLKFLNQAQKQVTQIDPSQMNSIKGRVGFSGIQEWLRLKRAVENIPSTKDISVQGLKPKEAIIMIEFLGTETQFLQALSQAGISINAPVQNYDNAYNTHLSGQKIYNMRLMTRPTPSGSYREDF